MPSSSPEGDKASPSLRVIALDTDAGHLSQMTATLMTRFPTVAARTASEALGAIADDVAVVCAVHRGASFDAVAVLRQIAEKHTAVRGVLVADYADYSTQAADEAKRKNDKFFLIFRPFKTQQLLDIVDRAMHSAKMFRHMKRIAPKSGQGT